MIKIIPYLSVLLLVVTACNVAQPVEPQRVQATALAAWTAHQHAVWEIDWNNMPLAGPVTAEVWRADGRWRVEILETPAVDLLGQTLVVDGLRAWRFNRLDPSPGVLTPATAALSPVTDVFAVIDSLLAESPVAATSRSAVVNSVRAKHIRLDFGGDSLDFFVEAETGLPLRIEFATAGQSGRLNARLVAPLGNPLPGLFDAP